MLMLEHRRLSEILVSHPTVKIATTGGALSPWIDRVMAAAGTATATSAACAGSASSRAMRAASRKTRPPPKALATARGIASIWSACPVAPISATTRSKAPLRASSATLPSAIRSPRPGAPAANRR
jgi:hypothetical protein